MMGEIRNYKKPAQCMVKFTDEVMSEKIRNYKKSDTGAVRTILYYKKPTRYCS